MFKLIFLAVGLGIGFGGGVYWANKNPEKAAQISAEEEKRFVEAQLKLNQAIKEKLDRLQTKTESSPKTTGNGFVGTGGSAPAAAADVKDAKADADKQEAELKKKLEQLK